MYQSTEQEAEMFGAVSEARPRIENARSQHPEVIYLEAVEDTTEMIEFLPRVKKETENEPVKKEEKLRLAEPDEIAAEVARATRRRTEEVIARQEEVLPEPPAVEMRAEPVEVAARTRSEPAAELVNTVVRPAVDVVGIALSLVQEQSEQSRSATPQSQDAQTMQQTAQVVSQAGANNYWEMATQQTKIAQALVQQAQPQQTNSMASVDLAPPSQAEFEDNFNDAIATGQSVGQFLSAQPVDLSRFELDEPSIQERQLVRKATVAIKTMTQPQVEKSIDQQLENLEDTGGFTDQSLAIFLISNNLEFEQYKDVDLSDRDQFYKNTQVYPKNAPRVDPFGVLRLGGSETYKSLVDIQWQR